MRSRTALVLFSVALGVVLTALLIGRGRDVGAAGNIIEAPDEEVETNGARFVLDSSGFPVLTYTHGDVCCLTGDVRFMHCNDANCSHNDDAPITLESAGITFDSDIVLASGGSPIIAYYDYTNKDLELINCGNPQCSSGNTASTPDNVGAVGEYASMLLDSTGNPVMSYRDETNRDLKLLHCGNPACTGGNSIISPDTVGFVGRWTSLALDAAGNPVVTYDDETNGTIKLLHCDDPNCSGAGESLSTIGAGRNSSLRLDVLGYPVVAYAYEPGGSQLRLAHCNDANCSGGDESITTPDPTTGVGGYPSLALDASGFPVIAYTDIFPDYDLKVAHCNDANCTGEDESIIAPDTAGDTGGGPKIALDSAGNPVVAYQDYSNDVFKLLHCSNAECSGPWKATPTPTTVLPAGDLAFVSTRDGNNEVYVTNAYGAGQTNVSNNAASDISPAWSPDGSKIAFASDRGGNYDIYVMNADGTTPLQLTHSPGKDYLPDWSADGSQIAFTSDRDGNREIYAMNSDGSGQTRLTNDAAKHDMWPVWSPGGSKIVFAKIPIELNADGPYGGDADVSGTNYSGSTLHTMDPGGFNVTFVTSNALKADWSPNATKLVFQVNAVGCTASFGCYNGPGLATSNVDGTGRTTIMPFDVYSPGYAGAEPAWSLDGTRITFQGYGWNLRHIFPDGTGDYPFVNSAGNDTYPAWQPVCANPPCAPPEPLSTATATAMVTPTTTSTITSTGTPTQTPGPVGGISFDPPVHNDNEMPWPLVALITAGIVTGVAAAWRMRRLTER